MSFKIAMFSPLSPQRSGISAYTEDLLPALKERVEVHVFVDNGMTPENEQIRRSTAIFYASQFRRADARYDYDLVVYQMGNSPVHHETYPMVFDRPGILVLHDQVLHHMIASLTVNAGDAARYVREMSFGYGAEGTRIAFDVATGRREPPFFDYPLSERAISASLGLITHSDYVLQQVWPWCANIPTARVPMGVPLPPEPDQAAARAALGLPSGAFIAASLGEATPHKRILEALEGFAVFSRTHPDALYVIVGNVAASVDLPGTAARLGISGRVLVTGYVDADDFQRYLDAADVCVNLRFPTAGETSATALRAMATGRPVLLSNVGANIEVPEAAGCFKLPVGDGEQAAITAALERQAGDAVKRAELGAAARAFVAREHSPALAADAYLNLFRRVMTHQPPLAPFASQQRGALLRPVAEAAATLGLRSDDDPLLGGVSKALRDMGVRPGD
ncbi:MAG: glycosyltransferase family 4 protein [Chloroflexi bacterium]|nr:glycosyltransferase family 4 protein [Chloroflexota bacterium]